MQSTRTQHSARRVFSSVILAFRPEDKQRSIPEDKQRGHRTPTAWYTAVRSWLKEILSRGVAIFFSKGEREKVFDPPPPRPRHWLL